MKISILGSTSFLAVNLLKELKLFDKYQVQNYCRNPKNKESIFSYPDHGIAQIDFNELLHSDTIIYTAGAGIQPLHQEDDTIIFEVNAYEPIRLIEKLTLYGYQGKLVTFGSYFEIGNSNVHSRYSEDEVVVNQNTKPNSYTKAKSHFSTVLQKHIHSNKINLIHFILPNIYGVGENENRLLPYLVKSIKNSTEMVFTSGNQTRQFLHIKDVAKFVSKQLSNEARGIYNLGNECIILKNMIEECVTHLESKFGMKALYSFSEMQRRDSSMQYLALNDQKARSELGWNPIVSLREGILEY